MLETYTKHNIYGKDYTYFKDKKIQEAWISLTGRKSITKEDIKLLKIFKIEVK